MKCRLHRRQTINNAHESERTCPSCPPSAPSLPLLTALWSCYWCVSCLLLFKSNDNKSPADIIKHVAHKQDTGTGTGIADRCGRWGHRVVEHDKSAVSRVVGNLRRVLLRSSCGRGTCRDWGWCCCCGCCRCCCCCRARRCLICINDNESHKTCVVVVRRCFLIKILPDQAAASSSSSSCNMLHVACCLLPAA